MSILNMLYGSGSGGYAIYDLSLTNDETNEKVIVKWFEYMPQDWVKTVVRYKTGSSPISPTDGTLAVQETTKNQYSSTGYSVSGLSDNTTYYFSVFAIDSNNTIIDVQSMSITTDFGWHPSANTRAYYPLTSSSQLSDLSGNGFDLTNSGHVTFGTTGGVDSALFDAGGTTDGVYGLYRTTGSIFDDFANNDYSISIWLYKGNGQMYENPRILTRYGNQAEFLYYMIQSSPSGYFGIDDSKSTGIQMQTGKWFNIVITWNHLNNTFKTYLNGLYVTSITSSWTKNAGTKPGIVLGMRNSLATGYGNRWDGGMGDIIIEKVLWTDSEVSDVIKKFKNKYGIS